MTPMYLKRWSVRGGPELLDVLSLAFGLIVLFLWILFAGAVVIWSWVKRPRCAWAWSRIPRARVVRRPGGE